MAPDAARLQRINRLVHQGYQRNLQGDGFIATHLDVVLVVVFDLDTAASETSSRFSTGCCASCRLGHRHLRNIKEIFDRLRWPIQPGAISLESDHWNFGHRFAGANNFFCGPAVERYESGSPCGYVSTDSRQMAKFSSGRATLLSKFPFFRTSRSRCGKVLFLHVLAVL